VNDQLVDPEVEWWLGVSHVGRREAHAELEHAERRTAGSVALRPERMWGP
jgi:hypothetical protein